MYLNVHHNFIHNDPIWKQQNVPSTGEWINKLWHIYTMEYYLALKKNPDELLIHKMTWIEFQKHYSQWKKPDTKDSFLYDSIYMKL